MNYRHFSQNHRPFSFLGSCSLILFSLGNIACGAGEADGGSIAVQVSGEDAATDGFSFPTGSEVTFIDGWELRFSHVLVTVDHVTISENPNLAPSDQSRTGPAVARADGPWAIDLTVPGSVPGAGGEGEATPLVTLENQNLRDGQPFAADETYAFGYDIVAATGEALAVNFAGDAEAEALYRTMIDRGHAVLYAGTARFRGGDDCRSGGDYDFSELPQELEFELGFATPTTYLNCQNHENQGDPLPEEEAPRGIALPSNRAALGQVTLHLEHPFFSSVVHDSGIYFDQMAARLVGVPAGTKLTTEDLAGVDPTELRDARDRPLPWRACTDAELPPGTRGFDVGTLPLDPNAEPGTALRDYRDFVSYVQSTQGHLNGGEGLCSVRRNYPSPR
ncbi:MAG TPA: hypothetical protein VGK73_07075 [Polyangiaceae bacterium]